jgi:pimeloyl-ACP methyl ester carboxylesterase
LLAIRHPEKVKKLAVTGANLWPDSTAVFQEVWDMVRPAYAGIKTKKAAGTLTAQEKNNFKLLRLLCDEPHIPPADLHKISCPSLVIGGDHDVIIPEHTMLIAHNIPRSYLWILPNSGHSTPVAYSALFNKTVDDFFSKPFRVISKAARFY